MARDKGKRKFVVESSSEGSEDEVPLVKTKKYSQGHEVLKDVAASGAGRSVRAESGKRDGPSWERRVYPRHFREADPTSKLASIFHEMIELTGPLNKLVDGEWLVRAKAGPIIGEPRSCMVSSMPWGTTVNFLIWSVLGLLIR